MLLEEELDLQLSLLKRHDKVDVALFPDDPKEIEALPHLKDAEMTESKSEEKKHSLFSKPKPDQILAIEESILEENTLETAMFCMVMAAFIFLPQIFHL